VTTSDGRRHPSQLWEGFWGIQLLHVGQSLGLFQALEQPSSPLEAAERLRLEPRYTELWCAAAHSCGLLEQEGERFSAPAQLRDWLEQSRGFTESHLNLTGRLHETFQAVFHSRALPEPPIALRLILAESLQQNYRWALLDVPRQVPGLGQALQKGSRLLEVGCGMGQGLGVLRSHYTHLELYGLESDYECAREAERSTRAVIHLGDLPGDRFGKTFDVVICFRALAASGKPEELLSQCARLLSPQGWLLLGSELQDPSGRRKTSARSLGEHFAYQLLAGEAPVNFFGRQDIVSMLERFGLKLEAEVDAPDWGTPLFLCTRQGNSGRL
jgi:SAM-dependent methyltransferase